MDWKLLATIPPLLLWFALFAYLMSVDRKMIRLLKQKNDASN